MRRALVGYVDLAGFGRGPQLMEVVEGLIGVGVGPVDDCWRTVALFPTYPCNIEAFTLCA